MAKGLPKALMSRVGKGQISMKKAWAIHKGGKATIKGDPAYLARLKSKKYYISTPTKKKSSKRRSLTKRVKSKISRYSPMARRYSRKRRSKGKPTIPIAPIIGTLAGLFLPAGQGYGSVAAEVQNGNYEFAFKNAVASYLFLDPNTMQFDLNAGTGTKAAIAGLLAHKVASFAGVNRALGQAKIPYIRI